MALAQRAHDLEALDRGVGRLQRLEAAHGPEQQLKLAVVGLDDGLCCKVRVIGELFALGDARGWRMNDFKGRHFEGEIVLWAVRWYCRYPISYRDLETMMTERGVAVDHSTIYRWVQRFAPEMEKRLRWQWVGSIDDGSLAPGRDS